VDRSLRWFTFLDAGQVFNPQYGQNINLSDLRYSTGYASAGFLPSGRSNCRWAIPSIRSPSIEFSGFSFSLAPAFDVPVA